MCDRDGDADTCALGLVVGSLDRKVTQSSQVLAEVAFHGVSLALISSFSLLSFFSLQKLRTWVTSGVFFLLFYRF